MNREFYEALIDYKSVPRTRGDEPLDRMPVAPVNSCSPHTRG